MFSRWEKIDVAIAVLFLLTNLSWLFFPLLFTPLLLVLILAAVIRLVFLIKKRLFWKVRNRLIFSGLFLIATPIFFLVIFGYILLNILLTQYSIAYMDILIEQRERETEKQVEYYLKLDPADRLEKIKQWLAKSEDYTGVAVFEKKTGPDGDTYVNTFKYPADFNGGLIKPLNYTGYFLVKDEFFLGAMKKDANGAVLAAYAVSPEFLKDAGGMSDFKIVVPRPSQKKAVEILELTSDHSLLSEEYTFPMPWVYQYHYLDFNVPDAGTPLTDAQAAEPKTGDPEKTRTGGTAKGQALPRVKGIKYGHFWLFQDSARLLKRISSLRSVALQSITKKVIYLLIAILVLLIVVSFYIGIRGVLVITRSLDLISKGVRRIRNGDFSFRIKTRSGDELQDLGESFNEMAAGIDRLLIEEKEKQRLEEELRIARSIQLRLLPPEELVTDLFELAAINIPATEIAGDYFDYFFKQNEYLTLLVADVSGKGASAAFYMAELKGVINHLQKECLSPARVIAECHDSLSGTFDRITFITICMAMFHLPSRKFTLARAGHTPALFYDSALGQCRQIFPSGVAVGLMNFSDAKLKEIEVNYRSGDILFLFSDGLSEIMNDQEQLLGVESLRRIIEENHRLSAKQLKQKLLDFSIEFSQSGVTRDDLTFIILKVK